MIIDAHAHYWMPREGEMVAPDQAHQMQTPEDILRVMDEAGVDKLLQVTRWMGPDNSYSLEGAARHPDRIRVLGYFGPLAPDMPARLRQCVAQPYIVGIRLWWMDIDLSDPALEPFWSECERLDVPLSVYGPSQAKTIAAIAARHPGLRLVADHVTVRVFRTEEPPHPFAHWDDVLALASLPNVSIKLSGLPESTEGRYPFPLAQEYLKQVYERFGPDRLVWGSNYPVTLRVCSYRETVDFVREACDFLPRSDREKILGGTALRLFRLPWRD